VNQNAHQNQQLNNGYDQLQGHHHILKQHNIHDKTFTLIPKKQPKKTITEGGPRRKSSGLFENGRLRGYQKVGILYFLGFLGLFFSNSMVITCSQCVKHTGYSPAGTPLMNIFVAYTGSSRLPCLPIVICELKR
jgi:hypothetical protein